MTDKQINKWLRHQFSPIGWVLLAYYGLINLFSLVAMFWEALRQVLKMDHRGPFWFQQLDMDAIAGNAWGYITAIGVLFVILYAWKGSGYWRDEVFAKEKSMSGGVFFSLLCMCIGSQMVNSLWVSGLEFLYNLSDKSLMPMLEAVSGASDTFSMFLYASILAPVWEELLFRGYILRTLRPYGKRFAILSSAVLFGLFHGNILQAPYAFAVGLVLGYVAAEYHIGWSVAIHMFNNLVLADLLTRLTRNLPDFAYNLVNLALFGGFFLVSLGILIQKRREIREYRQSEWIDRRCVKCLFLSGGVVVLTVLMVGNMISMLFLY